MENGLQWNRGDLKGRSKAVLHMHYWRVVFMTVLLSLFVGSGSIVSGVVQPILNEIKVDSEAFPDKGNRVTIIMSISGQELEFRSCLTRFLMENTTMGELLFLQQL